MYKFHRESGRAELMVGDRERVGFPLGVLRVPEIREGVTLMVGDREI